MTMNKIKVLHVYNTMNIGGAETFILNVYKNIDRKKIQFDFLCQSNKKGFYEDELKKMGSEVYHFKRFNGKRFIRVIIETIKVIKKNGPYDAIYIPVQFYSPVYCIAAKLAGVKKIVVHSHSASDRKRISMISILYQKVSRLMIRILATKKIACGKMAGEYLFGKKAKFEIVRNGIDFINFPVVSEKRLAEMRKKYQTRGKLVIGEVARFETVKNQRFFIKLAKYLKKKDYDFKIVLVGGGSLYDTIKRSIKKMRLENDIILPGPANNVNEYYELFDVTVMPSLYEGFPVSVLESLALGTPCLLSSNISREVAVVNDAVAFEDLESSIDCWVNKIVKLKKQDKEEMAFVLRKKGYDIRCIAREMLEMYYN